MLHLFSTLKNKEKIAASLDLLEEDTFHISDLLADGPLKNEETNDLFKIRNQYAINLNKISDGESIIDDVSVLMQISTLLNNHKNIDLTYWMTSNTHDTLVYFLMLHYLKKHSDRIHVINAAGLPFLNEENKLFFPHTLAELPEKEIAKCQKLSRKLSPSEWEVDSEEWQKIKDENADVRVLEGTKKILSLPIDHYDAELKILHKEDGKIPTTVNKFIRKNNLDISPEFLINRLTSLVAIPNENKEEPI